MFRRTTVSCGWRPKTLVERVRPILAGRAKVERKLATTVVLNRLRRESTNRWSVLRFQQRNITRVGVNASLREHGADWGHTTNDLARQNVTIFPSALQVLAVYEPMSLRSITELCASGIAPHFKRKSPRKEIDDDFRSDVEELKRNTKNVSVQSWEAFSLESDK